MADLIAATPVDAFTKEIVVKLTKKLTAIPHGLYDLDTASAALVTGTVSPSGTATPTLAISAFNEESVFVLWTNYVEGAECEVTLTLTQHADAQCGSVSIPNPSASTIIGFAKAQPDTNYIILLGVGDGTGACAPESLRASWYGKNTTYFSVYLEGAAGANQTAIIDWLVVRP